MEIIRCTTDFATVVPHTAESVLGALKPPEAAEVALAKLAVMRSLRFDFEERALVTICRPDKPGRTWTGNILKALHGRYGDTRGFTPADLEIEAEMLGLDTIIWPMDNAA